MGFFSESENSFVSAKAGWCSRRNSDEEAAREAPGVQWRRQSQATQVLVATTGVKADGEEIRF